MMETADCLVDTRIVVGPTIETFVSSVHCAVGPAIVPKLKTALAKRIRVIPVTEENKQLERKIRYQRTSEQILHDGWVFNSRIGNDLVTVVQGVFSALKVETHYLAVHEPLTSWERFQRWRGNKITGRTIGFHAICEARFPNGTFLVDIMAKEPVVEGHYVQDQSVSFGSTSWVMFARGHDSWSIGLRGSGTSMFVYGAIIGDLSDD